MLLHYKMTEQAEHDYFSGLHALLVMTIAKSRHHSFTLLLLQGFTLLMLQEFSAQALNFFRLWNSFTQILLEMRKLTTKVRKHNVLAGALGSSAAIRSHTFIFL